MAVTPTLGLKLQEVDNTFVENFINEQFSEGEGTVASPYSNLQKIDQFAAQVNSGKLSNDVLYPEFSASSTYVLGSIVTYGGYVWICHTAVTTAAAWSGTSNWTKTALPTIIINKVVDTVYDAVVIAGYSGNKSAFLADLAALSGLSSALEALL